MAIQPPALRPVEVVEDHAQSTKALMLNYTRLQKRKQGIWKHTSTGDLAALRDQLNALIVLESDDQRAWRNLCRSSSLSSLENTLSSQNVSSSPVHLELPSFNESWKKFPNKDFGFLKEFLGTVATVHATTAEVEGDFSRHKFSRTGRDRLRSFGIQSEIHVKQWEEISECLLYYDH